MTIALLGRGLKMDGGGSHSLGGPSGQERAGHGKLEANSFLSICVPPTTTFLQVPLLSIGQPSLPRWQQHSIFIHPSRPIDSFYSSIVSLSAPKAQFIHLLPALYRTAAY